MRGLPGLLVLAALAGCLNPGASEPARLWSLPPASPGDATVRVFLPAELRTPRVVVGDKKGLPVHRDLDRWEAPLADGLARHMASVLRGAGLRQVVVEIGELRVDETGRYAGRFRASVLLERGDGVPDLEIAVEGATQGSSETGERGLPRAMEAYASAAAAMGGDIRAAVDEAKGEVAKPAPAVTVPGK